MYLTVADPSCFAGGGQYRDAAPVLRKLLGGGGGGGDSDVSPSLFVLYIYNMG